MGQIYNKSITEGKPKRAKSQKVLKYGIKFDLNLNSIYYCQIILNNNKAMTHTITTDEIRNELVKNYTDVKQLRKLDFAQVSQSEICNVHSVRYINNFEIAVCTFSNDGENFTRFIHVSQTQDVYSF